MKAYLNDKEFLKELCSTHQREVFTRITTLDLEDKPIQQIEGRVTGGNVNIDGTSAVRRTCSISLIADSNDINEYYWSLKTKIKVEIGLKNNLNKYKKEEIIWFNMGIYLISSFSVSQLTTGITINISGKDKMCQLNGEMGGILMAPTDFGSAEEYDEFGNRTVKKIPVKQIIRDMIHQYADEDYSKIIIEDIEDFGLDLQTYRGSEPQYLVLNGTEEGARAPIQILPGNVCCWVPAYYDRVATYEKFKKIYDKEEVFATEQEKEALNELLKDYTLEDLKNYVYNLTDTSVLKQFVEDYGVLTQDYTGSNIIRAKTSLSELNNSTYQYLFAPGNSLTHEDIVIPVFFAENAENAFYVRKIEYGDAIGYTLRELTYSEEQLIANAGEALTSILDKIKNMLGDFEYFYDVDGNFIFRRQQDYKETYSAEDLLNMDMEVFIAARKELQKEKILEAETLNDDKGAAAAKIELDKLNKLNKYSSNTSNLDNSIFLIEPLKTDVDFTFENLELIQQLSSNPAIGNIKNDFTVWGNKKGSGDNTIPIHMRYAIDKKPEEYHSIEITPARAVFLLQNYPDLFPQQKEEIGSLAIRRLCAEHKGKSYYAKIPSHMKATANSFCENILRPAAEIYFETNDSWPSWIETDVGLSYSDFKIRKYKYSTEVYSLIDDIKNMVLKKIDNSNTNYNILLTKLKNESTSYYIEAFEKFIRQYNDVLDNLYDWRELIYQMAKDYRTFNHIDEFKVWLEEANPVSCVNGHTGYEQYYIDMEGFWRKIYDKEYHQVKWNDPLEEGRIYIVNDTNDESNGVPLLYNTTKLYSKIENNKKELIPDFDIYMMDSAEDKTTANEAYKKIGSLYDIIKNNYKILEIAVQRHVISDWIASHPEMICRLYGLYNTDWLDKYDLQLKDPQSWGKTIDETDPHYADDYRNQLHGFQSAYYHKGSKDLVESSNGIPTFLSASKEPISDENWLRNQEMMYTIKSVGGLTTSEDAYDGASEVEYAYRTLYKTGAKKTDNEREKVKKYLITLGKSVIESTQNVANEYIQSLIENLPGRITEKINQFNAYHGAEYSDDLEVSAMPEDLRYIFEEIKSLKNTLNKISKEENGSLLKNISDDAYQAFGLILLAMRDRKTYGLSDEKGYKTLLKEVFLPLIIEEIYIKRKIAANSFEITELGRGDTLAATLAIEFNNKFMCGWPILSDTLNRPVNTWFAKSDFKDMTLPKFFNMIIKLGDLNGNGKIEKEDFIQALDILKIDSLMDDTSEDLSNKIKENCKTFYRTYIDRDYEEDDIVPSVGDLLKELYYRITYDNMFLSYYNDYHYAFYKFIFQYISSMILSQVYKSWTGYLLLWENFCGRINILLKNLEFLPPEPEEDQEDIRITFLQSVLVNFKESIYSQLDFDEDGFFSLTDVQELIKIANEDENLKKVSLDIKKIISFDGEEKATFLKARFFFYLFFLIFDDEVDIVKDNNILRYCVYSTKRGQEIGLYDPSRNIVQELALGLASLVEKFYYTAKAIDEINIYEKYYSYVIELWILLLTPYALERTQKTEVYDHKTPYYVANRILAWSTLDLEEAKRIKNFLMVNGTLTKEDVFEDKFHNMVAAALYPEKIEARPVNSSSDPSSPKFVWPTPRFSFSKPKYPDETVSQVYILCYPKGATWSGLDSKTGEKKTSLKDTESCKLKTASEILLDYADSKYFKQGSYSQYELYLCDQLNTESYLNKGDVDNDGKITAKDARLALTYANEGMTVEKAKKAMEEEADKK